MATPDNALAERIRDALAANPNGYKCVQSAVVRPSIQYDASTAILCRAGGDLGATMTGHHDFQLADDVIHKVHVGHYTFYSVAVVKNDKLLIKANGVYATKYNSGEERQYELMNFYVKKPGTDATLPQWVIVSMNTKMAKVTRSLGASIFRGIGPIPPGGGGGGQAGFTIVGHGTEDHTTATAMWHQAFASDGVMAPTLFGDGDGDRVGKVLVQGTHIGVYQATNVAGEAENQVCKSFVNPYGFGPYTYQGCKHGREGKGEPLSKELTADNMAQYTVTANALIREMAIGNAAGVGAGRALRPP